MNLVLSGFRSSGPGRRATAALVVASSLLLSTCGGGGSPPTGPTPPSGGNPTLTITVTASGASPRTLTVPAGSRVMFVNSDSRPHDMTSDPHPTHEDCPELNQIGFLNPGQQRESGNLVIARNCGFHDHINPGTQSLIGTITIR